MKINQKFIIACSMICIILSLAAVSFSLAWYAMYPVFRDFNVTIGDSALSLSARVFTRTSKATTDSNNHTTYTPSWSKNVGKNFNYKEHNYTEENDTVNGTSSGITPATGNTGSISVSFPELTYSLFNPSFSDQASGTDNVITGGLLDPDTMSIDIRYLTFAMYELNFTNGFLDNYLYADLRVSVLMSDGRTLPATGSDGQQITEATKTDLLNNLVYLRKSEENNPENKTKTRYLNTVAAPNEQPSNPPIDLKDRDLDPAIVDPLTNYATAKTVISKNALPICQGYKTSQNLPADSTFSNDQVLVQRNNNRNGAEINADYYSYAIGFSLSLDPINFIKLMKDYATNKTKLTFTIQVNMHASDAPFTATQTGGFLNETF